MASVVLFHHAHGLTRGVVAFAELLRRAGHRVVTPDLYGGVTFATVEEGVAHAEKVGMWEIIERGVRAAEEVERGWEAERGGDGGGGDGEARVIYAGFSLGALPAQKLAQVRVGAGGAILYHGGVAASNFGTEWPRGVAVQVHQSERDRWCEMEVVRELVGGAEAGELFVYPGGAHLFTDSSLGEYDAGMCGEVVRRSLEFLGRVG